MKQAVLLLSGGLDSATVGAILKSEGYELYALSFDYGQRHRVELQRARDVAAALGVAEHKVLTLDLRAIGGSALTDDIAVPDYSGATTEIPVTYVPARNTVFLSLALGWAEVLHVPNIAIGVTAVDYSGYPDCRPEFIAAFETLANLATKDGVEGTKFKVLTPLISLTKAEIIRAGLACGFDYGLTTSCYNPSESGAPCGRCDSCKIRENAFAQLGMDDPVRQF